VPLSAAAAAVPGSQTRGEASAPVDEVAFDSRQVVPGALFFCVRGATADGHDFADEAVRAGAAALAVERWLDLGVPQILVPSVRQAMGPMSAVVLGDPAR
jgi:UDP-N-acetylmuramoyl-L-alanyl-D-glutamate--2,6-diaminopimelate ligase